MSSKTEKLNIEALKAQLSNLSLLRTDEDQLNLEAEAIHLDIMHTVRGIMEEQHINKKDLASKLNTSASYITQLFTADKVVNLKTLAKIQRALSMRFEFRAERVFKIGKESNFKLKAIERHFDSMDALKKAQVSSDLKKVENTRLRVLERSAKKAAPAIMNVA